MNYQFHFYPTLLNEYRRYISNPSREQHQKLLNRINRVPETDPDILKRFKRGNSFEDAVLKGKLSEFDPKLIQEAKDYLPSPFKSQHFIQGTFDNVRFYGYADVIGENRVIDLKSTANHKPGRHDFNFQNLYLYCLRAFGFTKMEYLICDGKEIYLESYDIDTYDFDPLLQELKEFSEFLVKNQSLVKDKKIMQVRENDLFS